MPPVARVETASGSSAAGAGAGAEMRDTEASLSHELDGIEVSPCVQLVRPVNGSVYTLSCLCVFPEASPSKTSGTHFRQQEPGSRALLAARRTQHAEDTMPHFTASVCTKGRYS